MGRRSRSIGREAKRLDDLAIKLIGVGSVLAIAPLFMSGSALGKALGNLIPIGLLMLAGGALLLWLGRRTSQPGEDAHSRPTTRSAETQARTGNVVDLPTRARAQKAAAPETPTTWGPEVFEVIEWRRFEAVVERLFAQAGFETRSQSHGADGGVDVWLYSRHTPGQPVSVVQCKHWQGKRVGVDKIRELRGVMAAQNVRRGQFATTSTFTPDAEAFARDNGINLLDVDRLLDLMGKRTKEQQRELLAVALEGDYWRPTCVNCGTKLVERSAKAGGASFWGCPTFPKCRTTMPMRAGAA